MRMCEVSIKGHHLALFFSINQSRRFLWSTGIIKTACGPFLYGLCRGKNHLPHGVVVSKKRLVRKSMTIIKIKMRKADCGKIEKESMLISSFVSTWPDGSITHLFISLFPGK